MSLRIECWGWLFFGLVAGPAVARPCVDDALTLVPGQRGEVAFEARHEGRSTVWVARGDTLRDTGVDGDVVGWWDDGPVICGQGRLVRVDGGGRTHPVALPPADQIDQIDLDACELKVEVQGPDVVVVHGDGDRWLRFSRRGKLVATGQHMCTIVLGRLHGQPVVAEPSLCGDECNPGDGRLHILAMKENSPELPEVQDGGKGSTLPSCSAPSARPAGVQLADGGPIVHSAGWFHVADKGGRWWALQSDRKPVMLGQIDLENHRAGPGAVVSDGMFYRLHGARAPVPVARTEAAVETVAMSGRSLYAIMTATDGSVALHYHLPKGGWQALATTCTE